MAVISAAQLTPLRQEAERGVGTVPWTKPQINAALQAVEDHFESVKSGFVTAIETAVPGVFSLAQKREIVKFWLRYKLSAGVQ